MTFLVLLGIFLVVVVVPRFVGNARARLLSYGLPARGLVLRAASTGSVTTVAGQRFQVRNVVLDVEVQGRAPYEVALAASFPRMCESFPGTALDLRVHRSNPNRIAVVGPAGSSAWIGAVSSVLPQPGMPSAVARGCGTVVVALIAIALATGAVISFVSGDDASHETSSVEDTACEAATRCCKTLGRTKCASFATMSETACKSALKEETRAAVKLGKTCK